MSAALTRRAALSGAVASVAMVGAAAAVAAMPAKQGRDPQFDLAMRANDAARKRFCAHPVDLENTDPEAFEAEFQRMVAASRRADAATPTNWHELVELFEHMTEGGESCLDQDNANRLLAHARRLAKMEG